MFHVFDAHCDVLLKMWENPEIDFKDSQLTHVNLERLKKAGVKVQCFAIYIPEEIHHDQRFNVALEMIDIFYQRILSKFNEIKLVTSKKDIDCLKDGEIGAVLTLEGCDAIGHDLIKLKTLFRLGIRSVGLTWNYGNAVADGVLEKRGAGLSNFGIEVVKLNNEARVWTDLSHLCEQSFWDTIDLAKFPIASHSNAKDIFSSPRNLNDEQIKAIIDKNGVIGITFVPHFLEKDGNASIQDIIKHIDHICSLGGEHHIGFGSDFDGISTVVKGLEHTGCYQNLLEELLKKYTKKQVQQFSYRNFMERFPR